MSTEEKNLPVLGFVTLQVPCRNNYLRIIRQSVMDLCARAGLSEFKAAQMEMAVDEACTNIIEHSYGGEVKISEEMNHPGIRINLLQYSDRIVVILIDHGKGFDFDAHKIVEPDQYLVDERERGLGMYIIKKFVDEATYEINGQTGHRLRLMKRIS